MVQTSVSLSLEIEERGQSIELKARAFTEHTARPTNAQTNNLDHLNRLDIIILSTHH
jgi:hypothetical protein